MGPKLTVEYKKNHDDIVSKVRYSKDSKFFASSGLDIYVNIYDGGLIERMFYEFPENSILKSFRDAFDCVQCVCFSNQGSHFAFGSWDEYIYVYDLETYAQIKSFHAHHDTISDLCYSIDDKYLASASYDGLIKIWLVENYQEKMVIADHSDIILNIKFSPRNNFLVSTSNDMTLRLWENQTGTFQNYEVAVNVHNINKTTDIVAFHPSEQFMIVAGPSSRESKEITILKFSEPQIPKKYNPKKFIPKGKIVFTSDNLSVFQIIQRAHKTKIHSVIFSNDGKKFFSGDKNGIIKCWDFEKFQCVKTLKAHQGVIRSLDVQPKIADSSSQSYVKLISGSDDGSVGIFCLNEQALFAKEIIKKTEDPNPDMVIGDHEEEIDQEFIQENQFDGEEQQKEHQDHINHLKHITESQQLQIIKHAHDKIIQPDDIQNNQIRENNINESQILQRSSQIRARKRRESDLKNSKIKEIKEEIE